MSADPSSSSTPEAAGELPAAEAGVGEGGAGEGQEGSHEVEVVEGGSSGGVPVIRPAPVYNKNGDVVEVAQHIVDAVDRFTAPALLESAGEDGDKGRQHSLFRTWHGMSEHGQDLTALLAAWVASVKIVASLLLVAVALFSRREDRLLRAAASLAMCLAIQRYHVTMRPLIHGMEAAARFDEGTSLQIDATMWISGAMWVFVCGWECYYWTLENFGVYKKRSVNNCSK